MLTLHARKSNTFIAVLFGIRNILDPIKKKKKKFISIAAFLLIKAIMPIYYNT